jgi:hypothetical protein
VPDHDRRREPVGSVAEETARLVEALGGWAQGVATDHRSAPGARAQGTGDVPGAGDVPGGRHEAGRPQTGRCEQCGSTTRAGEAAACQLCPICQGIAMLRAVRPETVERLADLAAALSGTLRDIAAERTRQGPAPTPPRGQRVQDIDVDDDDVPRAGGAADSRASAGGRSTNGRTDPMSTTSSSQESAAP